jgi:hypothetical protein
MLQSLLCSTRIRRVVGASILASAVIAPIVADVDTASALNTVSCDHPDVKVTARFPLGVSGRNGGLRHVTLKIRSQKTANELFCSSASGFTVVKHGVERTIEQASLKLMLKRATNECASLTAPGAGAVWSGKATVKYLDENGRRLVTSQRAGTFYVIDSVTRPSEGAGVIHITGTPTSAPATGPFAGTFLELNVTYDPPSLAPYNACLFGGWGGFPAPTFTYWHEA